jgi:hypothetical protein
MLGHKVRAFRPLTAICLEDLVPEDNCYRQLKRWLDLIFIRDPFADQRGFAEAGAEMRVTPGVPPADVVSQRDLPEPLDQARTDYSLGGSATIPSSGIHRYSAYAPMFWPRYPKTWSPFLNRFTSFPTASTSPANSLSRMFPQSFQDMDG